METETTFSRILNSVVFFIRSFTVPAFVLIVTAAVVAAMPMSLSADNQTYLSEIHTRTAAVSVEPGVDLSDSWTSDEETVNFDHMYTNR